MKRIAYTKLLVVLLLMPMAACRYSGGISLKEKVYQNGLEIKRGSSAEEFLIVTKYLHGSDELYSAGECEVEEYVVRQHPGRDELEIIDGYEYAYKPKEDNVDHARAQGKMEPEVLKKMSLVLKDDLLIVNAEAYPLNGRSSFEGCARKVRPLPEGCFYPNNPRYSRVWVEIKKGAAKGEFIIVESGSNGAMEPWNEWVYVNGGRVGGWRKARLGLPRLSSLFVLRTSLGLRHGVCTIRTTRGLSAWASVDEASTRRTIGKDELAERV